MEVIKEKIKELLNKHEFLKEKDICKEVTNDNLDIFPFLAEQWEYLDALKELENEGLIESCYCLKCK